eukprot:g38408.t1
MQCQRTLYGCIKIPVFVHISISRPTKKIDRRLSCLAGRKRKASREIRELKEVLRIDVMNYVPSNSYTGPRRKRRPGPPRILIDCLHAKENNPEEYNNNKCDYEYYNNYSYFRVFRHLQEHGLATYRCWWGKGDNQSPTITPALLEDFDMLFINLMHEEAPHFTSEEIACIHEFVEMGGALFMIGEHTNAYHHAEKMNPLLKPVGIEMLWASALEARADFATMPPGWILVRHFNRSHFISQDVTTTHMMAAGVFSLDGGTIKTSTGEPPHALGVAFLSDQGWAGPSGPSPPSFYGDTKYLPGMPRGHLPVAVVSEFGAGRVYAVSDQNMYGDGHLHFRHNFRQVMNALEWALEGVLKTEPSVPRPFRSCRPSGLIVGFDMRFRPYSGAKEGPADYHGFYFTMSRDHDIVPKGVSFMTQEMKNRVGVDDDDSNNCQVIVLPEPTQPVPEAAVEELLSLVHSGRTLVLLLDVSTLTLPAFDLLAKLAPDFSFVFGPEDRVVVKDVKEVGARCQLLARLNRSLLPGPALDHRLRSDCLDVRHISLQDHVLSSVSSDWGLPFLQTDPGLFDAALGCIASQSSQFGPGYAAYNVVDGNPATHSHTQPFDHRPWLLLDLQRSCLVYKVVLVNRIQGQTERLCDVLVELLNERKEIVWTSQVINPGNSNTALYYTVEIWKPPASELDPLDDEKEISPDRPTRGAVARYVRVSRQIHLERGSEGGFSTVLSLGQVQVLCPISPHPLQQPLVDAAALGTATQSSSEGNADGPENALDGSLATCTHTKFSESEAWWQVDLKTEHLVKLVVLHNRTDGWMCRFSDLTVSLSRDVHHKDVTWTSPLLNPNNIESGPSQLNVHVDGGVACRYVRVSRRVSQHDWDEGDRKVLSLLQVKVMCIPLAGRKPRLDVYDLARIGAPGPARLRPAVNTRQQAAANDHSDPAHSPAAPVHPSPHPRPPILSSTAHQAAAASSLSPSPSSASSAPARTNRGEVVTDQEQHKPGRIVVFLQDRLFRNRFLHPYLDKRPRVSGTNMVWLEYSLLDWLRLIHR